MHGILFTDCASIRAIGAYRIRTELHYNNVLWPDFTEDDFLNAIIDYQGRDRRFGMIQEQVAKA